MITRAAIMRAAIMLSGLAFAGWGASCQRADPVRLVVSSHAHEHAEEASDLDRPVEELLRERCEHEKPAFECDACRHEVGFVRAPASLLEGGLVTTVQPERRRVSVPLVLTGEVRFDERRVGQMSPRSDGVLRKVHVELGERVEQGQALVELESGLVGEAQGALLEAEGVLRLARLNLERVSELRKESIAFERDLRQARQELEMAEIRAEGARDKLALLGASTASRGRLVLRAPISGMILDMRAVPGEVVRAAEPLLTVGESTRVRVWADLYERDLVRVRNAQAVERISASITVRAYPGQEFPGRVDWVRPAVDGSSRTVKVRIEVDNPEGLLLPGMFASVELLLPGPDQVLAVPRAAVLEDEGRAFVFVHHQGEYYVRRPVLVGRTWRGWAEIERGLEPAETVVAEGAFLMKSDVLRSKMGAGCAD
jgi:cobalt-zinc-cadmium efflux system membrane fusion protein